MFNGPGDAVMVEFKPGSWREWAQIVLQTVEEVEELKREFYLLKGKLIVWSVLLGALVAGLVSWVFKHLE